MAREYMSVRAVAAAAGVSVQAVYKWIAKGELQAEVVQISEVERRYHVPRGMADRFLRKKHQAATVPAKTGSVRGTSHLSGSGRRKNQAMTGRALLQELERNGLIGMWADRDDIGNSLAFARKLRKLASTRGYGPYKRRKEPMTGKEILESGIVGLWEDRDDIKDNLEFARQLRKRASARRRG